MPATAKQSKQAKQTKQPDSFVPRTATTLGAELSLTDIRATYNAPRRKLAPAFLTAGNWRPARSNPHGNSAVDLVQRIRRPVSDSHQLAVISAKGGVGKTTTVIGLGATLATLRTDRVIAVDVAPDYGTLAQRITDANPATLRDLLQSGVVSRYPQVRGYTTATPSRLEILAADHDPQLDAALTESEFTRVMHILQHHYNVIINDCGAGLVHLATTNLLASVNQLVVVATDAFDSAHSAWKTLDWLSAHGHQELVSTATVVINHTHPAHTATEDLAAMFAGRVAHSVSIPFDAHLAAGAHVELERLRRPTVDAYRQLAACIADGFS